jgi:hypothetical protein
MWFRGPVQTYRVNKYKDGRNIREQTADLAGEPGAIAEHHLHAHTHSSPSVVVCAHICHHCIPLG